MPTVDVFIPESIQTLFFSGYNVFNTLVYGLILVVILYGIWKLFNKIDINPLSLMYSVIPFIVLGCSTRALVDKYILPKTVFLITPGIYFLVGFLCIISLLFSFYIYKIKDIDYRYVLFALGFIFMLYPLSYIQYFSIIPSFYIFPLWGVLTLIFYLTGKINKIYKNNTNLTILSVHLFDASTTFIATTFFNYSEQHVVPNLFYSYFNTSFTIIILKIIVITLSLYLIDKYIDDEKLNGLLKLSIFILGLAPGLRNFITLSIGI